MTDVFVGLALGLAVMWFYSRMAALTEVARLKSRKHMLMKQSFTHSGTFLQLLMMQKEIIILSLVHLRLIFWPAFVSCLPIMIFLFFYQQYATLYFFAGMCVAYIFAKWRWGI